jgi:ribosome-binding ATPase YchF (GTP1/OBG family)
MKIAIVGLPQAGQQELFSLLTGIPLETLQQKPLETHLGVCLVKDPRIDRLVLMYKPKKTTYARIEYLLLPDFNLQGPVKATVFNQLKNADELCFICRSDTAEMDTASFLSELIISDLILAEKRLENIAKNQKSKYSDQGEKENILMQKCRVQLEQEKPLHQLELIDDDLAAARTCQFLSMKPIILVINVSEDKIKDAGISDRVFSKFKYPTIQVSAELEQEIGQLSEADRVPFMQEMGIDESALNKMNRAAFSGLGLISFFTVGEDEVRSWPIKKGSLAPQAGGTIHSDIEKGFVRAEMFKYEDLMEHGSEAKLKELGKFSLKGRDYVVEDGDILSFRFNV